MSDVIRSGDEGETASTASALHCDNCGLWWIGEPQLCPACVGRGAEIHAAEVIREAAERVKAAESKLSQVQQIAEEMDSRIADIDAMAARYVGTNLGAHWLGARDELRTWRDRLLALTRGDGQ